MQWNGERIKAKYGGLRIINPFKISDHEYCNNEISTQERLILIKN